MLLYPDRNDKYKFKLMTIDEITLQALEQSPRQNQVEAKYAVSGRVAKRPIDLRAARTLKGIRKQDLKTLVVTDFEKAVVDAVRFRVSNTLRTSKPGDNTEAIARGTLAHSEGISEETVKDITAEVQRICVNARKSRRYQLPRMVERMASKI